MEAHLHPTSLIREVVGGRVGERERLTARRPPMAMIWWAGHAINFSKAQLGSNAGRHYVIGNLTVNFITEN